MNDICISGINGIKCDAWGHQSAFYGELNIRFSMARTSELTKLKGGILCICAAWHRIPPAVITGLPNAI